MTPWRPPGWPAGRIVIGTVGVLRPVKAHGQLIEAVAALTARGYDVGAVIVGSGPEESRLRRLVADLGLNDRVHLAGEALDVRPHLAGFDIFALTSSAETFSNAALEALALQCPVVASETGGMPEMLASGGGTTFKPGSVDAVVTALEALVSSESRRRSCAEGARNTVVQRFSLQSMVDGFRGLLANERATVLAAQPDQESREASVVRQMRGVRQ